MSAPTLHVIYAGRGDAMILEHSVGNQRNFFLVDGGPRNYEFGVNTEAPYHRYLASACREIMGDGKTFAGVVFSHPDEDHFGGYLQALDEGQIPFTDNVFIPTPSSGAETANARIHDLCINKNMDSATIRPQDPLGSYLIRPIKALFPDMPRILWYYRTANRLITNQKEYNENLTTNKRSILMYTAVTNSNNEMGIFFTGDSHADIISHHMYQLFPHEANRRFAIYKIQHHGSRDDNMKDLYKPYFSKGAKAVGFIYFLLKVQKGTAHMPFIQKSKTMAKAAAKHLSTRLKKFTNKEFSDLEKKVKRIQETQLKYLYRPAENKSVIVDADDDQPPFLPYIEKYYDALDNAMKSTAGWDYFLTKRATTEFLTYIHVRRACDFYSFFSSDVYVVSANRKYFHPRSETLVGLALAVLENNRTARLYVTNGKSLDMDELARVASVMGPASVYDLFCSGNLRVSYLSHSTYMSLSGASQGKDSAMIVTERDTNDATQEIQFNDNDAQQRTDLHVLLEQTDPHRILDTHEYQLKVFANFSWFYLYLQHDANGFNWAISDPNSPKSVWIDERDMKVDNQFTINCRAEKFGLASRWVTVEFVGHDAAKVNLFGITDILSGMSFFKGDSGLIRFDRRPSYAFLVGVSFVLKTNFMQSGTWSGEPNRSSTSSLHQTQIPYSQPQSTEPTMVSSSDMPLRQAFEVLGDPMKDGNNPDIIDTLSRLLRDKATLIAIVKRIPAVLIKAGFTSFKADLDKSRAIVDAHPLDGKAVVSAVLYQPMAGNGERNFVDISMAGLDFELRNITIKIDKCGSSQVHLTVESEAVMKRTGLEIRMAWKSLENDTIVSFSTGLTSIKDLAMALVNDEGKVEKILQGNIPLKTEPLPGDSVPSMGTFQGPIEEIGFSVRQPIDQTDMYDLADIWVRTGFPDWKTFLPIPETSKEIKGDVIVRVLNPLRVEASRITTSVHLDIPVRSEPETTISAQFDAIPLTGLGDYDYRFRITSTSHGVTITDIVKVIGLTSLSDKISNIPFLGNAFNSVQVRQAGLSVDRVKGKWEFQEWDFELYVPILELLPGSLSLVDVAVKVENFGKQEIQAKGEATFRSTALQKEIKVSVGLPTAQDLGFIVISSPDSLTLAHIFSIFGLGDLPKIPFLSGNTAVELSYCDAKFKKPKDGPITMMASTAKFRVKELVVEPFKMQDIAVSVSWQRGKESNTESAVSFELSALLLNINSVITVKYDGGKKEMTASITPITGSPMKVADVLHFLIRGVDSPLHSALASLEIKSVEMSLDVSTGSPSSFKLEMKNGATLKLPSATDTDPFTVGSITVEYSKVASKLDVFAGFIIEGVQTNISLATSTNPTTKDRSVEFAITLQKGQRELGLMALLAAVGINDVKIPRPEGCPEFTIAVAGIKGKFVDKDKLGLKFAELGVHVEMASVTLSDWDMSMDYIYVDVDYNKARTEKPFSALVSSKFTIAKSAEMTIEYVDAKDALELDAKLQHIKEDEVKVKPILEWLVGESIEDALPTFISEAVIKLKNSQFGMSLSRHKGEGNSVITVSLSFTLGSVTVQLARTRTRPDDAKKEDTLPWKTLLKLAVNTLPRPPPLPLIGQMEQPFSTQIYWTNSDILPEEVDKLNSVATFKNQQLLRLNRSAPGPAFSQGISFMLLENGEVILATKPRKSKKKDDPSGKMIVISEEEENPEAPEMKKVNKRVNGVNITNIGLEYDAKRQRIKVKFTARMTVGPFDGELINFSMSVNLPRGEMIDLSNWGNLDIDMGLDGLSLAMTGSSLNVAGTLHRIKVEEEDISVTGFEGGVSVKLKKYQFVGFGSYKNVKSQQEEFVSLMAYAMLNGPMVKTGLVELSGISGGFGFGSKLEIPSITDIHKFPLLVSPDVDPMIMFERLRGTGDIKYMTETNGANWVAAGVSGTACELIDVRAVLTIPLDPSAGEMAIVGIASAQFPRDAKPGKALAAIRINFQGSIDISRGFMLFEGRIADGSFILFDDCVLSGGFAVGAWFGPSPQAGDWCITIGGWHPKFQAPSHYPSAPPRMRLQWSYGDTKYLTLDGQAYAAVTPDAIMAGLAVQVQFEKWSCGANFDFRTDLILWLHPLHYDVYFHVSASLWYEVDAWIARKKLHISMGADLYISGPPFAGTVEFDVTVMVIKVKFGDHRVQDKALEFNEFMSIVLKNDKFSHVFSLESGGIVPRQAPTEAQTPDSTWLVRGGSFAFSIASRMPTTRIEFTGAKDYEKKTGEKILARPMQLPATSAGFKANIDVSVTNNSGSLVHGFTFEVIYEQLPKSLWGPFNSNPNNMLYGASESTVTHATGLSIQAPMARWSSDNPRVIQFSKVGRSEPVHASFNNDPTRDNGLDAKPRANEENPEAEFENAREALMGSNKRVEELEALKKRNARRSYIVDQWMGIRKFKSPASLRSDVPLRYAKDLAHFSHVAPRVSLE
ncbi:uncharacterized protein FTJAE_2168 [Fusarium tjaetaba]|uniref:DUF6603 domain-containing protein n=1 Tax=Fusarium tjaetaba TaxID=1567544 RepID=A0A8H5S7V1_9HYPO|nr:uncharacterized protein FTJAE_2168 [Fusarium tjaetaba]KAF5646079.1 hypothetical protein FTJAE_2168 [Fusarium tjaetaba]